MSTDKLAAIYVFCGDYHSGQFSRLYRLQCRIGKHLRLNDSAYRDIRHGGKWHDRGAGRYRWQSGEWSEAHEVYRTLVQNHGREAR